MARVNSTVDTLIIILTIFYAEGNNNWQDLAIFMANSAFGRLRDKNLEDLFLGEVSRIYPEAIRRRGKHHRLQVNLRPLYNPTEGVWTQPAVSRPFDSMEMIQSYTSGSKINFSRHCLVGGQGHLYSHTGVLMRIDGEEFVAEVIKTAGRPTTIGLTHFSSKSSEDAISVNNTYLCECGVDLHDIVYRLALVLGCELAYDDLRNNCDVVSTWLVSGQNRWILKSCLCHTGEWIANHLPLKLPPLRKEIASGEALTTEDLTEAERNGGATKLQIRESWHPE